MSSVSSTSRRFSTAGRTVGEAPVSRAESSRRGTSEPRLGPRELLVDLRRGREEGAGGREWREGEGERERGRRTEIEGGEGERARERGGRKGGRKEEGGGRKEREGETSA
eukprot:2338765-Rhodomonas_salina.1